LFQCFDGTCSSIFKVEVREVGNLACNIEVRRKEQFMEDRRWLIEVMNRGKDVQGLDRPVEL
jgi:hypothetical protein